MALWTQAEDETLKRLYAEDYSCAQIAKQIHGKTRNAVIGRVHRLGLPPRGAGTLPAKAVRGPKTGQAPRPRKIVLLRPPPQEIEMRCAAVEPLHVSLMEMKPRQCRFPYGGGPYTFCGHDVLVGSYCAAHFFLCTGLGTSSEQAAHRVGRRHLEGAK